MTSDSEPHEELHLCISCLASNEPEAHFCKKCGAPLDSYSATAPFERTLAQGFAFRAAVTGKPKLIVVIGMWILFFPPVCAAIFGLYAAMIGQAPVFSLLISLAMGSIGSILIYKTTKNYFSHSKKDSEQDAAANP